MYTSKHVYKIFLLSFSVINNRIFFIESCFRDEAHSFNSRISEIYLRLTFIRNYLHNCAFLISKTSKKLPHSKNANYCQDNILVNCFQILTMIFTEDYSYLCGKNKLPTRVSMKLLKKQIPMDFPLVMLFYIFMIIEMKSVGIRK